MTRILEGVMAYALIIALFWAFYDSTTFTRQDYKNVRKLGRTPWLVILGGGIVLNFWLGGFRFGDPIGGRSLTWIATVLVLVVYLYDLRPKLLAERLSGA